MDKGIFLLLSGWHSIPPFLCAFLFNFILFFFLFSIILSKDNHTKIKRMEMIL